MDELFSNLEAARNRDRATRGFEHMSVAELVAMRDEIDTHLPARSLKDVNLEQELLIQYSLVKELQANVIHDDMIPANQRSQVAAQVAATLQQMVKMQTEFYNAERFKAVENVMIKAIRKLPVEVAEQFITEYEGIEV
jgi:hypothetical protein